MLDKIQILHTARDRRRAAAGKQGQPFQSDSWGNDVQPAWHETCIQDLQAGHRTAPLEDGPDGFATLSQSSATHGNALSLP
jgi:hypothetical protein